MTSFTIPTSTITLELPWITIPAPWPIPYAALTTQFNPPTECAQFTYIYTSPTATLTTTTATVTNIGRQINLLDSPKDHSCFPAGYSADLWGPTFSPGMLCPGGYTAAATGAAVGTAAWEKNVKQPDGESKIACCPSGFTYNATQTDASACWSKYTATTSVLLEETVPAQNIYTYTKLTQVGPGTAYARVVQLRHNEEELKKFNAGELTGTPIATGTPEPGNPTQTSTKGSGAGKQWGGSAGSKGRLAVGVAVGVMLGMQCLL
ncbi:hypothetical protein DFH27DRAFT_614016 [Peziza echinospora]|nr:hypothetical protein DFH27DRAFT_614016 [Peziza echinospora]